ncbi:MAG: hypothetical protein M1818_003248 [Claussenomyces sp. TS43310]|nr:MAG: hypothetical protein M1818_003248 [Claussenomyces sp. TS43310]
MLWATSYSSRVPFRPIPLMRLFPTAPTFFVIINHLLVTTLSLVLLPYVPSVPSTAALVAAYTIYLHISNLINTFSLLGLYRSYPSFLRIYSAWLVVDAIFSIVPRACVLILVSSFSLTLCTGAPVPVSSLQQSQNLGQISTDWERGSLVPGCERTLRAAQLIMGASLVILMVVQLLGAVIVRHFTFEMGLRGSMISKEASDVECYLVDEKDALYRGPRDL